MVTDSANTPDLVGTLVAARYRILKLIGRGGLATVYSARDEVLGRTVAVKIIDGNDADASAVARERAEVELLASLNHPALVTLFDASIDNGDGVAGHPGRTILVMELINGPDLGHRIGEGPIATVDVATMAADLAEALHLVHSRGIVHRDIKPSNVLLSRSDFPSREFTAKLADFGIAYLIDSTRLTSTGTVVGTAAYLSPEQAMGLPPGPATDIYSLGLVLLEAQTLMREFPGTMIESLGARLNRDPEIPVSLGHGWVQLLRAMTARHPADRPTAVEVAVAARTLQTASVGTDFGTDRDIDLGLRVHPENENAGGQADATELLPASGPAATLQMNPTPTAMAPDATSRMEPARTRVLPTAATDVLSPRGGGTRVMPVAGDDDATAVLDGASPDSARTPRKLRRSVIVAVVILVLVVAGVLTYVLRPADETTPPPAMPTVSGQLGTDLQQLMDEVTP
ncbi:serine/threonine-protein kinase [Glaciihabitans sp. dw_435]|uniref:serine/threonine-protein kinase n=1 Tax=Glaciihabitans sp. dw_435 TaxID=2720081 RepID=UPI001BD3E00F|nr:serine/threonine-protein kinase [Glaciihabitans sp. dw_435]